jgi:hypothetical protein
MKWRSDYEYLFFSVSSVKISDLPQMEEESLVLAVQLETDSGKKTHNL